MWILNSDRMQSSPGRRRKVDRHSHVVKLTERKRNEFWWRSWNEVQLLIECNRLVAIGLQTHSQISLILYAKTSFNAVRHFWTICQSKRLFAVILVVLVNSACRVSRPILIKQFRRAWAGSLSPTWRLPLWESVTRSSVQLHQSSLSWLQEL